MLTIFTEKKRFYSLQILPYKLAMLSYQFFLFFFFIWRSLLIKSVVIEHQKISVVFDPAVEGKF